MVLVPTNMPRFGFSLCKKNCSFGPCKYVSFWFWSLTPLLWWFAHVAHDDLTHFLEKESLQNILIFKKIPTKYFVFQKQNIMQGQKTKKKVYRN